MYLCCAILLSELVSLSCVLLGEENIAALFVCYLSNASVAKQVIFYSMAEKRLFVFMCFFVSKHYISVLTLYLLLLDHPSPRFYVKIKTTTCMWLDARSLK